jgi:hypothetical protein
MKKALIAMGLFCLATSAWADKGLQSVDVLVPFAYESITATTTSQTLTSATYNPATGKAKRANLTCDTGSTVRYNYDGSTPTATSGHLVSTGIIVVFSGDTAIENARIIVSGAPVTMRCQITYER